jgi:hypothetical protein
MASRTMAYDGALRYYKTEAELKKMKKPIRRYYQRNNDLIQQYIYIDKLLDSSLPHNLIEEYSQPPFPRLPSKLSVPATIEESPGSPPIPIRAFSNGSPITAEPEPINGNRHADGNGDGTTPPHKLKRTPRNLYKIPDVNENTPLLTIHPEEADSEERIMPPWEPDEEAHSGAKIVVCMLRCLITYDHLPKLFETCVHDTASEVPLP